ncbi:AB hydrolase superfamily protein B1A11.02 [Colletotrichum gloeosporioides]|uniref:AB hydrolase superfamily protein B1A11.02 n=1 Tax=Colletotrichum gloeosporioides TaxID=474922 RepID=A0A8H4FPW9_COLGL|nr:AB hydrolase superfamily protein B1A11.02 [Colletotrichum gloeosporioides]KAF3808849.1 AB hydrolase superfamily protein B1A11.02 [Colletotrichum gloeosporioides]
MVHLKSKPDYTPLTPSFRPLPKNGHLANLEPEFAHVLKAADAAVAPFWKPELSLHDFRQAWLSPPPAPKGTPQEGVDVLAETRRIPVRDGAEVEIKIWRSKNAAAGADGKAVLGMRFHGGGWVVGGHMTEEPENLMLAGLGNVVVVSVDYRTAPEHKFPIPLNDCLDATKWVPPPQSSIPLTKPATNHRQCKSNASTLGIDPEKILLLGSSGGANIAIVTALRMRAEGVSGLLGQVLAFPVTCHPALMPSDKYELASYQQCHDAAIVDARKMEFFWDAYLPGPPGGVEPRAWHSPLLAAEGGLKGLPPVLMQVAGADPLRDEAIAFAERLQEEGVTTELHTYQGMPHCFYMFEGHQSTTEYYSRVIGFVKKIAGDAATRARL